MNTGASLEYQQHSIFMIKSSGVVNLNLRYEKIPALSADQIESGLFGAGMPKEGQGHLVYAAVYNLDEAAVVRILRRVLTEREVDIQLLALDAIEAFMQSRRTVFGAKDLKISVGKFATENPEYAGVAASTLAAISEFEEMFTLS
ncbi:hypothetical protein [Aliiroseovarius sp. 2305UL8-7]|uniref:hypothetical protein n=1 Tax=Aliiroseovarius conchicola TaxID=3121637 RepID=UPI0035270B36